MKLEKITHDHLLTKWLKVIIFAILMLAPIFSVAIRCAYVVCNKNAYQSYSGTIIDQSQLASNLVEGEDYKLMKDTNTNFVFNADIFGEFHNLSSSNLAVESYFANHVSQINRIKFVSNNNGENSRIEFYEDDTYLDYWTIQKANYLYMDWTSTQDITLVDNGWIYNINVVHSTLDNVFDYSVNKLKNDQLFNWTQNTGVYTGVNAMTTGLGLTDGTISILITYWTLLSIIYVIIDIVLEGFVALTHMILKKAS